jgi:hypothetical protein
VFRLVVIALIVIIIGTYVEDNVVSKGVKCDEEYGAQSYELRGGMHVKQGVGRGVR